MTMNDKFKNALQSVGYLEFLATISNFNTQDYVHLQRVTNFVKNDVPAMRAAMLESYKDHLYDVIYPVIQNEMYALGDDGIDEVAGSASVIVGEASKFFDPRELAKAVSDWVGHYDGDIRDPYEVCLVVDTWTPSLVYDEDSPFVDTVAALVRAEAEAKKHAEMVSLDLFDDHRTFRVYRKYTLELVDGFYSGDYAEEDENA